MLVSLALSLAVAAPSPCPAGQTVVMGCVADRETIALCAGGAPKPTFLQVRVGPTAVVATKPEILVPRDTAVGFAPFVFRREMQPTGALVTLDFTAGGFSYQVWTQDGANGGGGVVTLQGDKVLGRFTCTGPLEERWSVVEPLLFAPDAMDLDKLSADLDALTRDLDTPAPPTTPTATPAPTKDPIAGKSLKAICQDDTLLLGRFLWEDLAMDSAFTSTCCAKGVLDGDERCKGDWPSNDRLDCNAFARWRDDVVARFGSVPGNEAARSNLDTLSRISCTPKPKASPSSCAKAGERWSRDLQARAGGEVDGQQRSDLATALKVSCTEERWSEDTATCLAQKGEKACVAQLSFRQRRAARLATLGITGAVTP